jgi:hypothetical protein
MLAMILRWLIVSLCLIGVATFFISFVVFQYASQALLRKRKPGITLWHLALSGPYRDAFDADAQPLLRLRSRALAAFGVSFAVVFVLSMVSGIFLGGWNH